MLEDVQALVTAARAADPGSAGSWRDALPGAPAGVAELLTLGAGESFSGGAYTLLTLDRVEAVTAFAVAVDPDLGPAGFHAFAVDWLGHIFGATGDGGLLFVAPELGKVVGPIAADGYAMHTDALTQCLRPEFLAAWRAAGRAMPGPGQCAGMTVPLYLGGELELDNAMVVAQQTTWEIAAMTVAQVRGAAAPATAPAPPPSPPAPPRPPEPAPEAKKRRFGRR